MTGLLGSSVLEVAIGIVFVYLLLAVFCTTANEWVAAVLKSRGVLLQQGIVRLLAPDRSPAEAEQDPLVARFYNHPLIKSVMRDNKLPSYLSGRTFAKTIMDLATPKQPGSITFADLETGIKNDLPESSLRTSLLAVLQGTHQTIEDAQRSIEAWYEDHMDRVSGLYKRKTQLWTLILATIITIATNADTLHIASRLWVEPTLRNAMVESARSSAANGQAPTASGQSAEKLGLILGWQDAGDLKDRWKWAERIVGWALTILAVSLGTPFWFDILNRFMNLRSSGTPPAKKADLEPAAG